jgi:hypothetical protein
MRGSARGIAPALAGYVELFLDEHGLQLRFGQPGNEIRLVARIPPRLAHIPGEGAVMPAGPCGVALVLQGDDQLIYERFFARAAREITSCGSLPQTTPL